MLINTHKKDVIWNYLGIFFNLGSQVIWLPVLIHYLPPDILGLWYVFISIGGLVDLLDSGFTPTLSHNMSYAWSGASDLRKQGVVFSEQEKEPNYALVCGMMSTCRVLYFCIATAATFIMATAGTVYIQHIAAEYLNWQIYVTWLLYMATTFINLYIGYYQIVLLGIGDVFRKNKAQIMSKGAFLLLGTVGLISGCGLISLGIAYFASGFVLRFMCKYYLLHAHNFKEIFSEYKNQQQYTKRHILAMMWPNAWRDGLVTVTFYLTGQATVLLCSGFLSLYETGIYSFSMQIINAILGIAGGMSSAYTPAIQSSYVTQKIGIMKQLYSRAIACFFHLSFWGIIVFTAIGIPIVQFIRHDFIIDKNVFLVLALSSYLMSRHRSSAGLIATTNRLPYTFSFIFFGVVSLGTTYIALSYFHLGLWGLVLSPLIVQSIYNNWKWNLVVNRYFHITELQLLRDGTMDLVHIVARKIWRK